MLNNVVLVGRLVKDPDLRKTRTEGTSVASFRLASDDSFARAGQEKSTVYIDVTTFGKLADSVAKNMRRGSLVGVVGRLSQRKYISTKTNMEVTVTEIIANSVEFVGPKTMNASAENSGFQSDIQPGSADSGFGEPAVAEPTSSGIDIDIVDDDMPF